MDSLCIIIIFYNPTEYQIKQAITLSDRIHVIVVDNSSCKNTVYASQRLTYIALLENKGIAFAQNIGIIEARELGFKYILFKDQDSIFLYSDIKSLYDEYVRIKLKKQRIGAIGPLILNDSTGIAYKNTLGSHMTSPVSSIISSGMLVEMETLNDVGLMEDDLFIDNVDHEWCWRAQKKGYIIFMTKKSELRHSVGIKTTNKGNLQFIKSSPTRSYYKFRNNIRLVSRTYVPMKWKIKTMGNMIATFFLYLIDWKEYGYEYIKNASKGVKEAICVRSSKTEH